jgi:hypothetical protein
MLETDASLLAAYNATHYRVFAPGSAITLRINACSTPLEKLHAAHDVRSSAFITAYNPMSETTDVAINRAAQQALLTTLENAGVTWIEGEGVDPAGEWPAEASVLALGIGLDQARDIARAYRQKAFVFAGADAVPQLIVL